MHQSAIQKIIHHVCSQCRALPLSYGGIIIEFLDDLDCLGDAEYLGGRRGHIRFYRKFWEQMSIEQKTELIIHEMCHIILEYKYPNEDCPDHGSRWRLMMKVSGIHSPRACLD